MYSPQIDKELKYEERGLRAYPGKLLFGPTAQRFFADCLDRKPGMCGNIDFIHKINIDMLFSVKTNFKLDFTSAKTTWYPSKLEMTMETEEVSFKEVKMTTWNDIPFTVQWWKNKSEETLEIEFIAEPTGCQITWEDGKAFIETGVVSHDLSVCALSAWNGPKDLKLCVAPGEEVSFVSASAMGHGEQETKADLEARLQAFFADGLDSEGFVEKYGKEYQEFYDNAPKFTCNDPVLNQTWFYRWYILRNCTAKPQCGFLQNTTVYEGRAHKTGKGTPLKVNGWEFSRLICLSSPLQLTDYRWYPDKEMLQDIIRGVLATAGEDGLLQSTFTNHKGSPFANYFIWATYRNYLLDGDKEFIKEMLPAMKKCVDGNTATYGAENDYLQFEVRHQRTGKEYQPSYWYFMDQYPPMDNTKRTQTPIKRVDTTIYHYLNIKGLYKMMEAVGDPESAKYKKMAETLASQVNKKMWDENSEFYYDLNRDTDEKAMVKNIVGVYPYWAEISEDDQLGGIEKLFSEEYFNTGSVFSTVSRDCPAFAPHGGWMGIMKSRDSCVWDGPSWPYTNGVALEAIGRQSKLHKHKFDKQFAKFLRKYSLQHYRNNILGQPYLVEQYHAYTGENLSDEPDYNHSYYLDLIMSFVAGLQVNEEEMVIDPLDIGLSYFKLENVKVRGKDVAITFSKKARKDMEAGLNVYVDGEKAASAEKLCELRVAL